MNECFVLETLSKNEWIGFDSFSKKKTLVFKGDGRRSPDIIRNYASLITNLVSKFFPMIEKSSENNFIQFESELEKLLKNFVGNSKEKL